MPKKREVDVAQESLLPMPPFDWPKNASVLSVKDLNAAPIYEHLSDSFEGEARKIFHSILLLVMAEYCIHPTIVSLIELSSKYTPTDQAEVWRRALYIVGYDV